MVEKLPSAKTFTVAMQPVGRRIKIETGHTLLEAAQAAGVELVSLCGGVGACDSCKVRLVTGSLTPPSLEEQNLFTTVDLETGWRLACQCAPLSDVIIDIPPESLTTPQRLQVEGQEVEVRLDPIVIAEDLRLDPPTLDDLRSDTTRLNDAWHRSVGAAGEGDSKQRLQISHAVLSGLSQQLRSSDWTPRLALRGCELIGAFPSLPDGKPVPLLGLAVDVGTTKVAAYLLDLSSGHTLARAGAMNPQIAFGEDVISRIAYANTHADGSKTLQGRLVQTLNGLVAELCAETNRNGVFACNQQIVEAVVVGNTAMHHLFAGLAVAQLGAAPYVPAASESLDIPASAVGLDLAPGAYVHLPPNIAGYVGADHVSMLLATIVPAEANAADFSSTPLYLADRTIVALDIGTNTEISLVTQGRLLSCSCASGPAFEGAHIHDGMRAAPGAIERVQIVGDVVRIHTIGNQPPVGICGSGILDAVAQMLNVGAIDFRGVLRPGYPAMRSAAGAAEHSAAAEQSGARPRSEFLLAPAKTSGHGRDIIITRKDVNEIQLAKAAIRAGVEILLNEAGLPTDGSTIDDFIVAGAFGSYISLESAVRVGMFPNLPLERFHQVGNAAGSGARQMLVSASRRRIAEALAKKSEYIELSGHPGFLHQFSKALYFPKPHSAKEVG